MKNSYRCFYPLGFVFRVNSLKRLKFSSNLFSSLNIGFPGSKEGIILNISYLLRMIGFYYCHYETKALIPISGRQGIQYSLSYYPFNNVQEVACIEVHNAVSSLCGELELFNNSFASVKMQNVIIDNTVQSEIDLFQLFFGTNMVGII
ncbi:hypothetical protein BH09BAC2_BH09BAC2_20470 [soil metagenome]